MAKDNFMLDKEMAVDNNENLFAFVASSIGSFELACEDVDEAIEDSRKLLELWRLKDESVTDVVVQIFAPRMDGTNDSRTYKVTVGSVELLG